MIVVSTQMMGEEKQVVNQMVKTLRNGWNKG